MEPSSAPAHRGHSPWQGLLLAVSLLTFRNPPSTAQLTIESVPSNAAERKDVLLLVSSLPGNLFGFGWYKGEGVDSKQQIASYLINTQLTTQGPAYSSREIIYSNGSLLFQNVTQEDTGFYTLQIIKTTLLTEEGTGQLRVYPELTKPNITCNNPSPVEHEDRVVLTCEPETQDTTYLWLINNQSLLDSTWLELSPDNRTLTLFRVTRNDTGPYECETRNPVSARRSDPFYLNVLYGPDAPTISPSHSYYRAGANLSLSCHAASKPPAQYSWLINGRPQQSTQELFIPNITSSDSGSYTCLAHNSVTGLNRTTVKTITVSEPVAQPSIQASKTTVTEHEDTVVLTCLTNDTGISILWFFNNQILHITERMKLSQDNSTLTIDSVRMEDAGNYQCEVSNPVSSSKSDLLRLYVKYSVAQPSIQASNTTVTENKDAVVLTCLTNDTGISIQWFFNNQSLRLTERMKLSQDNSTLTIDPVRREDAGDYQCEVSNPVSSSRSDLLRLDVKYDPTPPNSAGLSAGAIDSIMVGVLAGAALIAPVSFLYI
ncbi:carcinoembryonic antigen-related cell adhesion molecule 6-like [Diceros bicornis minor]|uniref:carcinoembryonic antigen-related cell adhesion molecule 6-like n=1 Tax=Diceros bicornis minor TaxID=77932 RepID=UPI0026F22FBE|nr:carcinoembryonic antigen-related cell adhesion molecule 6-like [Diceros bicornis minor]